MVVVLYKGATTMTRGACHYCMQPATHEFTFIHDDYTWAACSHSHMMKLLEQSKDNVERKLLHRKRVLSHLQAAEHAARNQ